MRYFLSFIVIIALAIHSLPYLIKEQALIWLHKQGVNAPKLKSIDIKWLSGEVLIHQLIATKEGTPALNIDQLSVKVDYQALLDQRVLIEKINLFGLHSGIKQTKDEFFVGPIDINQFKSDQKDEEPQPTASPWLVGIKEVAITDLQFNAQVQPHSQQLILENAKIADFYQWDENAKTTLYLKGALNGSPLTINTTATPLPEHKTSTVNIALTDFAIESITQPMIPGLSALVDVSIKADIDLNNLSGNIKHSSALKVSTLKFKDKTQDVQFDEFSWNGTGTIDLADAQVTTAKANGKLDLKQLAVAQNDQPLLKLASFNWHGDLTAKLKEGALEQLSVSENITLAGLHFKQAGNLITIDDLALTAGKTPFELNQDKSSLTINSSAQKLTLKKLTANIGQLKSNIQLLSLNNNAPITLALSNNTPVSFSASPALSLSGVSVTEPNINLTSQALALSGPINVTNLAKDPKITANSTLSASALNIALANNLSVKNGSLKLSASMKEMSATQPVINNVQLSASDFLLSNKKTALTIAAFKSLNLSNGFYSLLTQSVDKLAINELKVASNKSNGTLSQVKKITIDKLQLKNNNNLTINSVNLNGSNTLAHVAQSGSVTLIDQLSASFSDGKSSASKSTKTAASSPFNYAIAKITLTGNNHINIEDKSVDPWFTSQLNIQKLSLSSLNSASKNANSTPLSFDLNAIINDSANLSLLGKITPFANEKSGDWDLNLKSLSMPVISPYAGKFSGYFLESGKFTINSSGKINKNALSGKNNISIQKLAVRSAGTAATQKTNSSLSMPLDIAISVLESDDGKIELSVPITGDINDPNFGYSSVLSILAKKGLKQAAFGILSKAIQPYGALITIANSAIDAKNSGSFINLAPVAFEPGKDVINNEMKGYLQKIASMMDERQRLKLNICATGVAQDKELLRPSVIEAYAGTPLDDKALDNLVNNKVQELATSRIKMVQTHLKSLKVDNDRLFVCFAKTSFKDAKQLPVVNLGL
ncbi:DUF748 domain-containing protein [Gammaproteobacteria bacterium AS21]